MSNNRRLPPAGVLGDDPVTSSSFPTMGKDMGAIVQGLVDRAGDPRAMMSPRYGSDGLCSECGLSPDQPAPTQASHPYMPVVDRTPGVHQDVDWGRVGNTADLDVVSPGQPGMDIQDPVIESGEAEQRFRAKNARHLPMPGGWDARPREQSARGAGFTQGRGAY